MTEQSGDVLYPKQNHEALGDYYLRHISAMTGEGLHDKGDIAAQLAWRDREIDALRSATPPTPEQAGPSGEALRLLVARAVREWQTLAVAMMELEAALASPGAMEGAQAAQPLTDRQQRVVTFALSRFASGARSRAEAAAQDKQERYFKPGDVAAFLRDAEDAEALLKVDLLRAHPPTGEPT